MIKQPALAGIKSGIEEIGPTLKLVPLTSAIES